MKGKVLSSIVAVLSIIGIGLYIAVATIDPENAEAVSSAVSPLVTYSVGLLLVAIAAALIVSLLGVSKNPAALKNTLIGLVILAVIIGVSYGIASDSEVLNANKEVIAAAGSSVSKLTSAGILVTVVLLAVAGLFFVVDLLKGLVK